MGIALLLISQEKWLSLMCGYIMPLDRRDQVLAMNNVVDRLVDSGIVQKFFRGMLKFDSSTKIF